MLFSLHLPSHYIHNHITHTILHPAKIVSIFLTTQHVTFLFLPTSKTYMSVLILRWKIILFLVLKYDLTSCVTALLNLSNYFKNTVFRI